MCWLVLLLLVIIADAASKSWDLASNYSLNSNPNGQWTYGYLSSGSFIPFTTSQSSASLGELWYDAASSCQIWKNTKGYSSCGIDVNKVGLSCDGCTISTKWTAPYAHYYYVSIVMGDTYSISDSCTGNVKSFGSALTINAVSYALTYSSSYIYTYSGYHFLYSNQTIVVSIAQNLGAGNTQAVINIVEVDSPSAVPSRAPTVIPSSVPSTSPTNYPSLSPHSISVISTIAGTGTVSYSGDGGQATSASVNNLRQLAVDSSGNIYVSDYSSNNVRKITMSTGIISTYAGSGSISYNGDGGVASSASLHGPQGLYIDTSSGISLT